MSTGADCHLIEEEPGRWYYDLQRWPYGEWPEYDRSGPFRSQDEAIKHLHQHHANPGGYSVQPYRKPEGENGRTVQDS